MRRSEKRIVVSAILFAIGFALHLTCHDESYGLYDWNLSPMMWLQFLFCAASYLIVGYTVLLKSARNIRSGNFIDEHLLMSVATLGAFAIKMFPEAAAVMLFFQIGEWFEDKAVNRTRKSIADLIDIQADLAHVIRNDVSETVDPEEVRLGEIIEVLPGEKIPIDGKVVEGSSTIDAKALTGESIPRDIGPGDNAFSGTINLSSRLLISTTKVYEDSTATKLLELVEEAAAKKAKSERFVTTFARYYTPAVMVAAFVVAVIPSLMGYSFEEWLYKGLTLLVVSCPCALVISVPLSYFCGIGASSKMGVLVKGANYIDLLSKLDAVVFDKTGTLTEGKFAISSIHPVGCTEGELLSVAASAEVTSNHPISRCIVDSVPGKHDVSDVEESVDYPGKGIVTVVSGHTIAVGNTKLMDSLGVSYCNEETEGTNVHVAKDGTYLGHIVVSDVVKEQSASAIKSLKEEGVSRIVMLTGDSGNIANAIGVRLGIDHVASNLLPSDKIVELEKIIESTSKGRTVAFVGDGINDAPSLARADVGIAMGALGSDAAVEAADVVIMDDNPYKIPRVIRLSRKNKTIVWQNIVFALTVKFAIMIFTIFYEADMWLAVFGDVGVSVIAILNAMRMMRFCR